MKLSSTLIAFVVSFCFCFTSAVLAAEQTTVRNCSVRMFGLRIDDRVACDGSYNQFCGHKLTATITIGVDKERLNAPIKRIGFMGTDSGAPFTIEKKGSDEYHNGLWDLSFELAVKIAWLSREHRYKGAFFVETEDGSYYWLKQNNSVDYEFGSDLGTNLSSIDNGCN